MHKTETNFVVMAGSGQHSYQCTYCPYLAPSLIQRLDHYKYVHSNEPGFQITCRVDNCPKRYTNIKSLKYHIKSKHYDAGKSLVKRTVPAKEPNVVQGEHDYEIQEMDTMSDQEESCIGNQAVPKLIQHDYTKQHALFLLNMKEFNKVPQTACNKISDQIQSVLELNNEQFGDRVNRVLQEKGCVTKEDITRLVAEQNANAAGSCENLNSAYKLDKYAHDNFDVVDPEDIILGIGADNKPRTMQYIPIEKSLKQLLNHEDVMSQVLSGHTSQDGKLRDFCDGTVYQENPLFKQYPNALQIQLYNDEFCVANALGYRQRKWKINAIYYALGNLEPKHRSRCDMIQLVCLAINIHVKQYGLLKFLEPILADIKKLEKDGITITFEGSEQHFYATISFIAADNLAAHILGRFFENFSTVLRLSRTCNITKHNLRIATSVNLCQLRTRASYDEQAAIVAENPHLDTLYGIKGKSPLNELQYYHIIDGLPHCLAHDLFEGVGPTVFELVVKKLITLGFFTLEQFWARVENFPYMGSDLANRPSVVTVDKLKLKFTQSQTWCFLRLCPLMIGDYVPEDHPLWNLAMLFLDVLDQVLSPVISHGDIHYMQQVIEDFLTVFKENFPNVKFKPKAHYMLHYPSQTKKFGPLIHCWTMRFEAEHNEHKQVAARTKNKRNVCKTMAKRKQSRQALFHAKEYILHSEQYSDCVGVHSFPVQLLNRDIQQLIEPHLNGTQNVEMVRAVTISGTTYRQGSAVVLGELNGEYDFGRIDHIFIICGVPFLCCMKMCVCGFNEHYHSYMVEESVNFVLVQVKNLLDYHPLGVYQLHGRSFISLRYKLACI